MLFVRCVIYGLPRSLDTMIDGHNVNRDHWSVLPPSAVLLRPLWFKTDLVYGNQSVVHTQCVVLGIAIAWLNQPALLCCMALNAYQITDRYYG